MRELKMNRFAAALSLVLVAAAFAPASTALADDFAYGPDTCRTGYVWREAQPFDRVCVLPSSRTRAAQENLVALSRIDPAGAYGPFTCISGYVWREAFPGDAVCVIPSRRAAVARENAEAALHRTRG
jgi:hypothetical protein